jgi:HD-GYP domain-containing protein (c-di-GMP phosphodiesterase class II)
METPDAMRILRDEAGTAFDPACVAALEASLDEVTGPEPPMLASYARGLQ